jgi:galactose mutarotase-like enzyme
MAPAGPFEGPGGQHGFARWADYIVTDQGESALTLEAKRDDGEILLTKRFGIAAKEFTSETILRNPDAEMLRTSLGEHYYYPLAGEDTSGLTIDGVSIDELLGEGTLEQIMSGEAAFWRDFPGLADIHFPAGYTLRLEASTEPNAQLGVLLWHKPDTETICFEPTAGYIHTKMNSGLGLEQGESASLTSSLTLI